MGKARAIQTVLLVIVLAVAIALAGVVVIREVKPTQVVKEPVKVRDADRARQNFERASYLKQSIYDNYHNDEIKMLSRIPFPFNATVRSSYGMLFPNIQASVWEYGSFLSMLYKFAVYESVTGEDIGAIAEYDSALDGLMYYRKDTSDGKFDGYRHYRDLDKGGQNINGISYDDDMWLARDIVYMYELTGDQKYLDYAIEIADYLIEYAYVDLNPQIFIDFGIEGVNPEKEMGGFYWDSYLDMLHTCSNGPAIIFYSDLYKYTNNELYLSTAKKAYEFVLTLRGDAGVFYDCTAFNKNENNEILSVKSIDKRTYTYNTGTPISGAVSLYENTGDEKYLNDAISIATAAGTALRKEFEEQGIVWYLNAGATGGGASTWFNGVLFNGFIDLLEYSEVPREYIEEFDHALNWAYDTYLKEMSAEDKAEIFEQYAFCNPEGNYVDKEYGKLIPAGQYIGGWDKEKYMDIYVLNICGTVDMIVSLAAYYAEPVE